MAAICSNASAKTLTFDCGDACPKGQPCLVYSGGSVCNSTGSVGSTCVQGVTPGCSYECFAVGADVFSFRILHGEFQSDAEINNSKANPELWTAQTKSARELPTTPSASNDKITAIGRLALPSTVTRLDIYGGNDPNTAKGFIVDVHLEAGFVQDHEQLVTLTLDNLNLGSRATTMTSFLPKTIRGIDISNNQMQELPLEFNSFPQLKELWAKNNYFKKVTRSFSMPNLTKLMLRGNNLQSFTADVPNLEELNLANNSLTAIPEVIFSLTELRKVNLSGNPITDISLTKAQAEHLQKMEFFIVDQDKLQLSCDPSKRSVVANNTVCLLSDDSASPSLAPTSRNSNAAVIGGIIAAAAVIVLVVLWWCCCKRKRGRSANDIDDVFDSTMMPSSNAAKTDDPYSLAANHDYDNTTTYHTSSSGRNEHSTRDRPTGLPDQLASHQLSISDIEDVRELGGGGYGVVWLVRYRGNMLLASKRLRPRDVTAARMHDFIREIQLSASLHHTNIIEFIGVAWSVDTDLQALFEYASQGDLRTWLAQTENNGWSSTKLEIACDIVDALKYVHSLRPPLVHRDLKSRNVLLMPSLRAKLCDFGVSRFQSTMGTMTVGVGTILWIAPEVISGSRRYDDKADIYSFGVVLSELDTHELPYFDVRGEMGERLPEVAIIHRVGLGSLSPSFSRTCPFSISSLAKRCLAFEPADRPSAMEVAHSLACIRRDLSMS